MIEDRDYMRRRPSFEMHWSATLVIIAINVVIFIIQNAVDGPSSNPVSHNFALSLAGLKAGHVWQLITFQFLHLPLREGGIFHILGNMFTIYVFGHAVEEAIGRMSFVRLYLLSGVVGGMVQMAGALFFQGHFGGSVVGASAGAFGLVAAFATLFPHRPLSLFFLPLEFRARTLLWLSIAMSCIGLLLPSNGIGVAHLAHLGGIITGFFYIRWITSVQKPLVVWQPFKARSRRRELVTARSQKPTMWQRPSKPAETEELPPAEFISKQVDPILDKISAHGIQSLTDRERQILESARARMSKR